MNGAAAAVLVAAWLCAMPATSLAASPVPSFDEVRRAHRPSDRLVVDRHGEPLQTLRTDPGARRLDWVPLQDISPALLDAVVLGEDRRFLEHGGVDWSAAAAGVWSRLTDGGPRGASTLTMQLAGLLDPALARPSGGRDVAQKLAQVRYARALESRWRKDQILEAYLNRVGWRGELVGIDALAQTLFRKRPSGLDAQESALAAALLRAPNALPARVAERACGLLQQQGRECRGVVALAEQALARRGGMPMGPQLAPHLARRLRAGGAVSDDGPAVLASTLDAGVQRLAIAALGRQMAELQGRGVADGAVLVLDNRSGDVLAWVGSSGGWSGAAEVDGVLARRQPGSTVKPFAYALAFERRLLTPASLLHDAPAALPTAAGAYVPQNYDHRYRGWVSARTALASSLNVPAVRVGTLLGVDALHARLQRLGFALERSGGHYGASLALGSAEVSLLALTNAYRTLANGGLQAPVRIAPNAPPAEPERVVDPAASHLVGDVLADDAARAAGFGLASALATRGWAAVKTGTSKDMRDNWCVGWTERYTVGVWVGNASGAAMHDVSGVSGAAPIWQELVRELHRDRPSRPPARPDGVVPVDLRYAGGEEPPRRELFIAGTEQALVQAAAAAPRGIVVPQEGARYALDPDMPAAVQRIRFAGAAGTWRLGGRVVGRGGQVAWAPWPGRHELVLQADDGRELGRVRFEVRGATLRVPGGHEGRAAPKS